MSRIKEDMSDSKPEDQKTGTQRSTLSFKDKIELCEKWKRDLNYMYYDIQGNCGRECQETEDDKLCNFYRKMTELHGGNEGVWGKRRVFD